MKVIDSDNYRASGIETFFFPGGEPHARIPENFGPALLFLKPRTWNDVGIAYSVLGALWEQGKTKDVPVWLFCPYFPGARQDRTDYRTPVTKKSMANILGEYVHRLYTFDMHSNSSVPIIISRNFGFKDLFHWIHHGDQYVIAPDAGAAQRAADFAYMIRDEHGKQGGVPVIQAKKSRDFAGGALIKYELPPLPAVGCYIVVDDICDGGATFNCLAEAFLQDQYGAASKLILVVSHGIFSKGLNNIHPKYESIVTTDSWARLGITGVERETVQDPDRLDVVSLRKIIDKILEESEDV